MTDDGTCSFCGARNVREIDVLEQCGKRICVRCVAIFQFLRETPVGLPSVPGQPVVETEDLRSENLRILQELAQPDDGIDRSAGSFPSRKARESRNLPETHLDDMMIPEDESCLLCGDDSGEFRPYVMRITQSVICRSCLDLAVAWLVHPQRH